MTFLINYYFLHQTADQSLLHILLEGADLNEYCYPDSNVSCVKNPLPKAGKIRFYMFLGSAMVSTVLRNSMVINSVAHFKQLHTSTNILLFLAMVNLPGSHSHAIQYGEVCRLLLILRKRIQFLALYFWLTLHQCINHHQSTTKLTLIPHSTLSYTACSIHGSEKHCISLLDYHQSLCSWKEMCLWCKINMNN